MSLDMKSFQQVNVGGDGHGASDSGILLFILNLFYSFLFIGIFFSCLHFSPAVSWLCIEHPCYCWSFVVVAVVVVVVVM